VWISASAAPETTVASPAHLRSVAVDRQEEEGAWWGHHDALVVWYLNNGAGLKDSVEATTPIPDAVVNPAKQPSPGGTRYDCLSLVRRYTVGHDYLNCPMSVIGEPVARAYEVDTTRGVSRRGGRGEHGGGDEIGFFVFQLNTQHTPGIRVRPTSKSFPQPVGTRKRAVVLTGTESEPI
jgi:hypothetical protein